MEDAHEKGARQNMKLITKEVSNPEKNSGFGMKKSQINKMGEFTLIIQRT